MVCLPTRIFNFLDLHSESKLFSTNKLGLVILTILLFRLLAPLHGIDYLTPSIVALAARKVFRHRIVVTPPGEDRSLQYGSNLHAVSDVLADVTPDSILDGILALEPPL